MNIKVDILGLKHRVEMMQGAGTRTAFSEGVEEGVKKGYINTAKKLLSMGIDIAMICQATGLTEAEVLAFGEKS